MPPTIIQRSTSFSGEREPLLLLVRHGDAETDHPLGDARRELTDEGRTRFARAAASAAGRAGPIARVIASPYVRTMQTADILAEALGDVPVEEEPELGSERSTAAGVLALARTRGLGIAIVGHNPAVSEAAARIIGAGRNGVPFRPGTIAAFARAASGLVLRWVAGPGQHLSPSFDAGRARRS